MNQLQELIRANFPETNLRLDETLHRLRELNESLEKLNKTLGKIHHEKNNH